MHFDFFVSYARSDNATGWITRFVEELLAEHKRFSAGYELRPFFDQHAITTGADWQIYLAHGIAHSRLFLAFLSPNYIASEWCRKEWRAWMDAEIAQHILTAGVRPIYIVEVPGLTGKGQLSDQHLAQKLAELSKLPESDRARLLAETPPVVKHLRRRQLTHNQPFCDVHAFFDAGLDALRRADLRQVLGQLAHDLDHHAALLAQADASLSTIPAYNKHFTGRLDELLLLRERLIKDDRTGVIYGIQGLGGIGKTELALTYAHAYASAYPGGRFLIRCEGKSVLRDAVLGQSDLTGLFGDQISDEERKLPDAYFAAVLRCLRARLDRLGHVLLVLDNVSDLALLGHQQTQPLTALGPQLHLLATTRLIPPAGGKGNWLSLGQLPDVDALDLLEKFRPFASAEEREAARRIVKRLGGFTLAVELAAAHLAEHPDVTCARMADIIGLEDLENPVVVESADRQNIRYEHDRRLSAVLGPTLAALSPPERRVLEYAALLPPDHIPLPWLKTLVVADFPEIGQPARLTDPWNDLWRRLEKLALFTRPEEETTEPRLMRVHRLVQELVRQRAQSNPAELRLTLLKFIRSRSEFLENHWLEWQHRWELEPLHAIASILFEWDEEGGACIAHSLVTTLNCLSDYHRAEQLARRTLEVRERILGIRHRDTLRSMDKLASILRGQGYYCEAEFLYRRALAGLEGELGKNDDDTLTSVTGLGVLLSEKGDQAGAEPYFRRALEGREQTLGLEHTNTLVALHNLAFCLTQQGNYTEAEPLQRRALAARERLSGPENPQTLNSVNALAILLAYQGRLSEAESLFMRALHGREKLFGPDNDDTLFSVSDTACFFELQGRLKEAECLHRRAWEGRRKVLGADHPLALKTAADLAGVLEKNGQVDEANTLRRHRVMLLASKADTSFLSLRQLALDCFVLGDYAKAGELLNRLLHADFEPASTRHHLARLCLITDRFDEAGDQVAQGWAARAEAKPYIIPRLLWFQLALEFLRNRDPGFRNPTTALILGRLKTALQSDGAFMGWTMRPVLDHLKPRLNAHDHSLLTALVAVLSDRVKLPELDHFPEWLNAAPQPLE